MAERTYKTKGSGYAVKLNGFQWDRADFAWLGTIDFGDGRVIGWAWHLDGRSIDRGDRAFDLADFSTELEDIKPLMVRQLLDCQCMASRPRSVTDG